MEEVLLRGNEKFLRVNTRKTKVMRCQVSRVQVEDWNDDDARHQSWH